MRPGGQVECGLGVSGRLIKADESAVCTINRHLLVCQASIGGWKPDTREGCPYISFDHMKLDGLLLRAGIVLKSQDIDSQGK